MATYRTCALCFVGQHERCEGVAYVHHVGGAVEETPCACDRAECVSPISRAWTRRSIERSLCPECRNAIPYPHYHRDTLDGSEVVRLDGGRDGR